MPDRFVRLSIVANFFTLTARRLTTLVLSVGIAAAVCATADATGPLRVNPANPRYFVDANGTTVFLAGSYQNPYNLLNSEGWDFANYFDYLALHNHNFTRLPAWEQSPWMLDTNGQVAYTLQPYERTGSSLALDGGAKFDLARFNQAYFDQLRSRVVQAGQRGIYVSVILFEGFSSQRKVRGVNPWLADPFQRDNNVNGIDADPNGSGRGEEFFSLKHPSLTALQEAFVRKLVDTLNDLDNVLYEISGDTLATSLVWQYHMIDYLKQYLSSKPNRHPVGISQFYAGKLDDVLNSQADWVVTEGTSFNPPLVNGNKVVFNEGSPILFAYRNSNQWVWRAFTRGYNLIYSEAASDDAGISASAHAAIAQARAYSQFLNLNAMYPSTTLCSMGFCLGSQGTDYLVYLPTGGQVSVNLTAAVNFLTAWFDPETGQTISGDRISGGKRTAFTSPIRGHSVLQIFSERPALGQTSSVTLNSLTRSTSNVLNQVESSSASQEMVSTPTITPNGGIYSGSVRVSISTKTKNATIYYTTDGKSPTQSSAKYTGSLTLSGNILVKAKAFKIGRNPSAESSAWFADIGGSTGAFNFTLANSGDKSVTAGSSTVTTITATLSSESSQTVAFAVSGLPSDATGTFSSAACSPACSTDLTINTTGSTPPGSYPITVTATGGGLTRSMVFTLSVTSALTVATPSITPNGGSFSGSVSVAIQSATSGSAIYYTTDGSTPTQVSTLYTGAITLTSSATIKVAAFKSGYNPSPVTAVSFTKSPTNSVTGNAYYVAKTGSDSYSCSQALNSTTPKLTIGAALACVGPAGTDAGAGYTVHVAAGTYTESIVDKIPSGSGASDPFTLQCATDFACVLSPGGTNAAIGINAPSHWIIVRGFKTTSGGGWYLSAYPTNRHHHISFINNEWDGSTMHATAMGIQASSTDTLTVRGNRIYGLNGDRGYSHAIYAADSTNNWLIEQNDIHNNGAYGIHIYGTGSTVPAGFTIRDNRTYRNGTAGVNGTGIIAYGPNHQIYRNVAYSNVHEGILIRSGSSGVLVFNNTMYANAGAGYSDEGGSATCKNNLSVANAGAARDGCAISSNNLTNDNASAHFANAAQGDFTLISGSPAIDAGTNSITTGVTVSYAGTAPDAGALEK